MGKSKESEERSLPTEEQPFIASSFQELLPPPKEWNEQQQKPVCSRAKAQQMEQNEQL